MLLYPFLYIKLLFFFFYIFVFIFIIILLLAGQATCELSLPTYTSNIINIGIQQGGIENPTPEVIRAKQMNKLFVFMSDKNKDTVLDNYKLLNTLYYDGCTSLDRKYNLALLSLLQYENLDILK